MSKAMTEFIEFIDGPVFYCEERPNPDGPDKQPLWRFYCPHCRYHHVHGAGEGYRVAHCPDRNSPYYSGGYYLLPE